MTVLFVVFVLALAACGSQESVTAPVQPHPQAAKTGEAAVSEGATETDRAALVAFYEALGYVPHSEYNDWNNWLCEVPLDQWDGVTTDENGRITGLDLRYYKLRGSIPPELGNLSSLQYLNLSDFELRGSIPPELGNLSNLRYLDLSGNDLIGLIPPELGNLGNLQNLDLGGNGLRGLIPPELGNLGNLQNLDLGGNELCESIPPELGNLSSLQYLNLSRNDLIGLIPPELGNLDNLRSLGLYHNDLIGLIPSELGNLGNLQFLNLGWNDLSGSIPPELAQLDSLQYLYLEYNDLSGCIPSALLNVINDLSNLGLSVCGDEPEPVAEMPEPTTELTEAIGLIVRDSGTEIVRVESGQVTGEIEVGHGKETALLSVRFIAEDGDLFTPDEADDFSLGWEIADGSIAEVDQHAEDGAWAFHILGLEEGETTIRIKINHEGHADFISPEIEIHVSEDGPGEEHEEHDEEG